MGAGSVGSVGSVGLGSVGFGWVSGGTVSVSGLGSGLVAGGSVVSVGMVVGLVCSSSVALVGFVWEGAACVGVLPAEELPFLPQAGKVSSTDSTTSKQSNFLNITDPPFLT